jgi:hypothetical protein
MFNMTTNCVIIIYSHFYSDVVIIMVVFLKMIMIKVHL